MKGDGGREGMVRVWCHRAEEERKVAEQGVEEEEEKEGDGGRCDMDAGDTQCYRPAHDSRQGDGVDDRIDTPWRGMGV